MDIPTIEQHYKANYRKLVKRMYFRSGNPHMAEDVVQTAYERAIKYKEATTTRIFDAWFSTVLNNCLRDAQNDEKGYSYRDEDEEETTEDVSCPHYPARMMKEIFELIGTKSEVQKEVLDLYFHKQYTGVDISHITTHSAGNIRQIISRFRQELKELYG